MTKIYPSFEQPSFIRQVAFELNSLIGRKLFRRKSEIKPIKDPLLIDFGAGSNFTEGWVHVDFYKGRIGKFYTRRKKTQRSEVETDLRYPLICPDSIVDGVYSSHTLEHLYPNHAYNFLSEIYRILKPGSWVRIAVPDLELIVNYYTGKNDLFDYEYRAEAISNYTQNWGHHSVWDKEILSKALEIKGFINIRKVEFGIGGTDKRLIKEEAVRKIDTLVVEGQKPY